jgi:hypothetical protein
VIPLIRQDDRQLNPEEEREFRQLVSAKEPEQMDKSSDRFVQETERKKPKERNGNKLGMSPLFEGMSFIVVFMQIRYRDVLSFATICLSFKVQ